MSKDLIKNETTKKVGGWDKLHWNGYISSRYVETFNNSSKKKSSSKNDVNKL